MKNKPTMIWGLSVIFILSILAIFAFLIIPDDSTDANNQIVEIPLKPWGYKVKIFNASNNNKKVSFGQYLLFGQSSNEDPIPYDSVHLNGQTAVFYTPLGTQRIVQIDADNAMDYVEEKTRFQTFYLGTDRFGRDLLSRLILGIRISLFAGFMAVIVSILIGVSLGSIAGYFGGWLDQLVMYLINVTWSIPTILLVFAIVLAFGRGLGVIFLAVGLTMWVDVARIVRGQVLSIKEQTFVLAAKSIGLSNRVIIMRHILPNIAGPLLVIISANFATAILIEAGLSYLGFGVNPPAPSLGNLLNENYGYVLSGNFGIAVLPALLIMILVLAFNLIGSGLRDIFDIK